MKNFGFATVAATALTAAALGLAAPALAAPTAAGNAEDTITALEEQGYHVVVNRLSDRGLDEASVVSVGEGATFTHTRSLNGSDGHTGQDRQFAPVNQQTVYVNVR